MYVCWGWTLAPMTVLKGGSWGRTEGPGLRTPSQGSFASLQQAAWPLFWCSFIPTCSLNPVCISKPLRLFLTSPLALWNVSLCANLYTNLFMCISASNSLCCINTKTIFECSHSVGMYVNVSLAGTQAQMSADRDQGGKGWPNVHDSACSRCLPCPWLPRCSVEVTLIFLPVPF